MTHRLLLLLSIMLLGSLSTFAQDLTFGFKAGLNYSGISGPSETTASGDELEEFPFVMGFHAAAIGQYMVNEKVGFAAELLYIQKNARYRYEGDGYRVYYETGGSVPYYVEGQDKVTLGITNTYVGLPLYVIYQPIDQVRVGLGASVQYLIGSKARGESTFASDDVTNGPILVDLNYLYLSDEAGQIEPTNLQDVQLPTFVLDDAAPNSAGAYANFTSKDGAFYNRLDASLLAEVDYMITSKIFVGLRYEYGLLDATNNFYDRSNYRPTNGALDVTPVSRDDKDNYQSYQLSLSFLF